MKLLRRLAHNGYACYKGDFSLPAERRRLLRDQFKQPAEIERHQLHSLRKLVDAALKTPFHRARLAEHRIASSADLATLADIQRIPIMSRADLQANLREATVFGGDLIRNATGGSTGQPVSFYAARAFQRVRKPAANFWAYSLAGYSLGEKLAVLWGSDTDLGLESAGRRQFKRRALGLFEKNSFHLNAQEMEEFRRMIVGYGIRFLKGYAGSVVEFARYIQSQRENTLPLQGVICEAEQLTAEGRRLVRDVFGVDPIDYYGSREFGTIAVECCEHSGYHVNWDQLLVEVATDGRILVTSFETEGTIFLRYETGDLAEALTRERCPCGRSGPRFSRLIGRQSDHFLRADGTRVHGEYLTHLFYGREAIRQFQAVQHALNEIEIKVVAAAAASSLERDCSEIRQALQALFGPQMTVRFSIATEIPKTATGKFRFTISHVKPEQLAS